MSKSYPRSCDNPHQPCATMENTAMTTNDKPVKINASFEQAMRFFATQPDFRRKDSQTEESCSTTVDDHESEPSTERNAQRP